MTRRAGDHVHPEYWTEADQERYERRVAQEVHGLRGEVKQLADRVLMMLGAIGLLAFLLPLAAPFIRAAFGVEATP